LIDSGLIKKLNLIGMLIADIAGIEIRSVNRLSTLRGDGR